MPVPDPSLTVGAGDSAFKHGSVRFGTSVPPSSSLCLSYVCRRLAIVHREQCAANVHQRSALISPELLCASKSSPTELECDIWPRRIEMRKTRILVTALLFAIVSSSAWAQVGTNAPDGERCRSIGGPGHGGCASGYCMPGPAVVCSSDVSDGICTNRDYNCALPGARGGLYGDTATVGGVVLTCQNPGGGRWGQFCQRR